MDQNSHKAYSLQRPPWSGNAVRPWVRVLAGFFLACAALAFIGSVFMLVSEGGIPRQQWLAAAGIIAAELYLTIVFAHVALRGIAPKTWVPWR